MRSEWIYLTQTVHIYTVNIKVVETFTQDEEQQPKRKIQRNYVYIC